MNTTTEMLQSYPKSLDGIDSEGFAACIGACYECAQVCTACSDACLAEDSVADLATCIRTDLDCADICTTTGAILSRRTGYDAHVAVAMLQACATACHACAEECAQHAEMHEHCRICAEVCRRCEQACRHLLTSMG